MDILDGIATMRHSFMAANMNPPATILLRQTSQWVAVVGGAELGKPVEMADGSVWMECSVMDVAVRWPANRMAMPDGSWLYA